MANKQDTIQAQILVRFFVQVAWKKEIARVYDADLDKLPAIIRRKCWTADKIEGLGMFGIKPVFTINPESTFAKFVS